MNQNPTTKFKVFENLAERMVNEGISLKEAMIAELGVDFYSKKREEIYENDLIFQKKLELKEYAKAIAQDDIKGRLGKILYHGVDKDAIQAAKTLNDIYGVKEAVEDNVIQIQVVRNEDRD